MHRNDVKLLAEVYGLPTDGDALESFRRGLEIVTGADPELVDAWLARGQRLPKCDAGDAPFPRRCRLAAPRPLPDAVSRVA